MLQRASLLAVLAALFLAAVPLQAEIVLTATTPAKAAIVIPNDADAALKTFAELLQTRVEQSLGRKLDILNVKQIASPLDLAFNVGPTPACLTALPEQRQLPHGYEIKSDGKANVYFAAKDEFAVGFAVTEFAEQILNVRQYMPAPLGVCATKTDRVVIPDGFDYVSKPDYASVWFSGVGVPGQGGNAVPYKEMDLALQAFWSDKFHHAMLDIFNPEKYGKTHPEYYPERNGQRYVPLDKKGKAIGGGWQPCLSNPDVRNVALHYCLDFFKKNPSAASVSIAINDGGGYCQCAKCLAKEKELGSGFSGLYFDFANQIARELNAAMPGKKVGFLRYGEVNAVPSFPIEKNVLIYDVHPGSNDIPKWIKTGASVGIYTWVYGFNYVTPRYYPHEFQKFMKLWKEQGATGFYGEAYPDWIISAPMVYMAAKIARHLDADPDAMLKQYASDMFGPDAGPDIVKFYNTAEAAMERRNGQKVDTFEAFSEIARPIINQFQCWRAADVTAMDAALASASTKVAPGSLQAQRLDLLNTWWSLSRSYILAYDAAAQIDALAAKTPAEVQAIVPLVDTINTNVALIDKVWDSKFRDVGANEKIIHDTGMYLRNELDNKQWQTEVINWVDPHVWPYAALDTKFAALRQSLAATMTPADLAALFKNLAAKQPAAASYYITQATLAAGEPQNIVTNPSFEEIDPADKDHVGAQDFKLMMSKSQYQKDVGVADDAAAHTGKRSFRFGTGGGAWLDRTLPVAPGGRYLVRVWVRDNSDKSDDRMNFLVLDKDDKLISVVYNIIPQGQVNEWRKYEAYVSIPPNCEKLSVDIYPKSHAPGDVTWFDDLYVGRVY